MDRRHTSPRLIRTHRFGKAALAEAAVSSTSNVRRARLSPQSASASYNLLALYPFAKHTEIDSVASSEMARPSRDGGEERLRHSMPSPVQQSYSTGL
jgi:hypothetical protein